MAEPKKQNYLHGAAILAAGVVIMKVLGAIYKIPLGNILGDEGYAHFLVAYNIYSVFLTLATAGLPVALSRMISEANTMNCPNQVRRIFSVAWWTFFVLGVACTLIMALFPTQLADMLSDIEAAKSIFVLSPAVLLVCLTSAYRGYCQGHENMTPTTVGQVLEVLAKVVAGLALAWYLTGSGHTLSTSSAGAIFGVTVGSLVALAYMFIYKRRHYRDGASGTDMPESRGKVLRTLLRVAIPITLGSSVLSLINLIDSGLCMGRLQDAAGFSYQEATVLYGVYGKAQTLYNLPASFITPLTISVVPAIAAAMVLHHSKDASRIAENSMRIAVVVALPMGVGLSVLAQPIMDTVYPDSHASGGVLLTIMGVASFFVCMALMMNAILQAGGNEKYPIYSMIAGGAVKIGVNWVLVANPEINIVGAPIGTLCCYAVMCVMDFAFICKCLPERPSLGRILLRPAIACAAMGLTAWAVYGLGSGFLGAGRLYTAVAMVLAIGAAVIVYFVLVVVLRAITYEDMKLIPKGEKLARILHIK